MTAMALIHDEKRGTIVRNSLTREGPLVRLFALTSLLVFVVVLAAQHIIVPGLDPLRHEISEYANARAGWLMVVGFSAWACSLFATGAAAAGAGDGCLSRAARVVMTAALGVAGVGMVVTAIFPTQTSAGRLPPGVQSSVSGQLHNLGSGTAMLTLIAAAVVSALAVRSPSWFRPLGGMLLVSLGLVIPVFGLTASDLAGLRQRLLVLAACVWQAALLYALGRCRRSTQPTE
jgi:hypothetical protein